MLNDDYILLFFLSFRCYSDHDWRKWTNYKACLFKFFKSGIFTHEQYVTSIIFKYGNNTLIKQSKNYLIVMKITLVTILLSFLSYILLLKIDDICKNIYDVDEKTTNNTLSFILKT